MSELVLTPRFERAFRRLIGKNPALQSPIEMALRRMAVMASMFGASTVNSIFSSSGDFRYIDTQ